MANSSFNAGELNGGLANLADQIGTVLLDYDSVDKKWYFMRSGNVFMFMFNGVDGANGNNVYTITNQNYLPNIIARGMVCSADASSVKRAVLDAAFGNISLANATSGTGYFGTLVWTRY